MKPLTPKFLFHYEELLIEIFEDGMVLVNYKNDHSYNEWLIKKTIISAEQRGRFIWISTDDHTELGLDCKMHILFIHQL